MLRGEKKRERNLILHYKQETTFAELFAYMTKEATHYPFNYVLMEFNNRVYTVHKSWTVDHLTRYLQQSNHWKLLKGVTPPNAITVTVKSLSGDTNTYNVSPMDTVFKLKQLIHDDNQIDIYSMRLILNGKKQLDDDEQQLQFAGVENNSTIHCYQKWSCPPVNININANELLKKPCIEKNIRKKISNCGQSSMYDSQVAEEIAKVIYEQNNYVAPKHITMNMSWNTGKKCGGTVNVTVLSVTMEYTLFKEVPRKSKLSNVAIETYI